MKESGAKKNILICTLKTWNLKAAWQLKQQWKETYNVHIISTQEELTEQAEVLEPDYIFFPHWSYLIPESIYTKRRCIVFHMTDLPFGRGGSPLQNLIERGYSCTKISAIQVVKELDAGPVYRKETLDLSGSAAEIFQRAAELIFHRMIPDIVSKHPIPQKQEGEVVYFRRRKPEESEIQPNMPINKVYDYIRMLDAEGYPAAFIPFGSYHLKLTDASYEDGKLSARVEFAEVQCDNEQ